MSRVDDELEEAIEIAVARVLGEANGPGDQQLRARRLIHVVARACAKVCGETIAAAEAFTVGRKLIEPRLKP